MIDSQDLVNMQNDIGSVIADVQVEIAIRRDGVNLPAQTVRLVNPGRSDPKRARSEAGQETDVDVIVLGGTSLDIRKDDKFIYQSLVHEVVFVSPGQDVSTEAVAVIRG